MPHLIYSLLLAVLLSAAVSLIGNRTVRERLYAGVYMLLCCGAAMLAGSWTMYLIHG